MRKRIVLLALGSVLLLGAQTFAQDAQKPAEPAAGHQGRQEGLFQDLNLTPEQKEKMRALHQQTEQQAEAIRNDSSLTGEQKHAKLKDLHESSFAQIKQILTPEQQKLMEERRQKMGAMGPGDHFPEGLNLTDDQKQKIRSLHENARSQMEAIRNDSSLTEEQKQATIRDLHRSTREQMMQILTPEQQKLMQERHKGRHGRGRGRGLGNQGGRLDARRGGFGPGRLGPGF